MQAIAFTSSLGTMIENHRKHFAKSRKHFEKFYINVIESIGFYKRQFKTTPAGKDRAGSIIKHVDKCLEADKPLFKDVTCKKGCSHCCYVRVAITDDEADLLAMLVDSCKLEIDKELMAFQAKHSKSVDQWNKLPYKKRACIFLDQERGACRVYSYRPVACRKYFVQSDPVHCSTEKGADKVQIVASLETEIVASAALDIKKEIDGTLPWQLKKKLK